MHSFLQAIFPFAVGGLGGIGVIYAVKQFNWYRQCKKLVELDEAPFPFYVRTGGSSYYIVFDLGEGMKLWCDYNFGIREDGLYGINGLTLEGFNSSYNTDIELKIGQSVFPLVEKMQELTEWLDEAPFEYEWNKTLAEKWDEMKKKLNNLRYLEAKSKEKEKKQK